MEATLQDDKRFDAAMKIAEFWAGRHDARREFEWKVTLGFWAVILGAISYHEKLGWPRWGCVPAIPVMCLVMFLIYYRFWLRALWSKNVTDSDQAFDALEQAKIVVRDCNHLPTFIKHATVNVSWRRFVVDWAMLFQALATALLLVMFCIIAWQK